MAQPKTVKMPNNINHPSINLSSPFISLDGNNLIFIADNGEDNVLSMNYTSKIDAVNWKDPVLMPRHIQSKLNFLKGYALSANGSTLLLTNSKSGGIGGFDIYISERKGAFWTEPINLGFPLNSKSHDGCPSLSADGQTLYFMRCELMDVNKAEGCKIFVSKLNSGGQWEEPTELPQIVNTGNSQTPRILGDGETLIFSSDKFPQRKGGLDLYMTRIENGNWSAPVPLDFVNTTADDQYISATSLGRYLLKDVKGALSTELMEVLFPKELKPKGLMKIEGQMKGLNINAYISTFNLENQKRVSINRPDEKGGFIVYLKEGGLYDLSIEPEIDKLTYFSKVYDLRSDRFSIHDKIEVELKELSVGDEMELSGITFQPFTSNLDPSSSNELRRLIRLIQGNPSFAYTIDLTLHGLEKDSVKSSPDLSEVHYDTIVYKISYTIDSLVAMAPDSLSVSTQYDSVSRSEGLDTSPITLYDTIRRTMTRDSIALKATYHNDRTSEQLQTILNYLVKEGVNSNKIYWTHRARPVGTNEQKRILAKLIVKRQ